MATGRFHYNEELGRFLPCRAQDESRCPHGFHANSSAEGEGERQVYYENQFFEEQFESRERLNDEETEVQHSLREEQKRQLERLNPKNVLDNYVLTENDYCYIFRSKNAPFEALINKESGKVVYTKTLQSFKPEWAHQLGVSLSQEQKEDLKRYSRFVLSIVNEESVKDYLGMSKEPHEEGELDYGEIANLSRLVDMFQTHSDDPSLELLRGGAAKIDKLLKIDDDVRCHKDYDSEDPDNILLFKTHPESMVRARFDVRNKEVSFFVPRGYNTINYLPYDEEVQLPVKKEHMSRVVSFTHSLSRFRAENIKPPANCKYKVSGNLHYIQPEGSDMLAIFDSQKRTTEYRFSTGKKNSNGRTIYERLNQTDVQQLLDLVDCASFDIQSIYEKFEISPIEFYSDFDL